MRVEKENLQGKVLMHHEEFPLRDGTRDGSSARLGCVFSTLC